MTICTSPSSTYKQFALVDVFAPAVRVFDLLAEDKRHLKEEEVALSTLTNQGLWVPHLERLLQDELTLGLNIFIKSCMKEGDISMMFYALDLIYRSYQQCSSEC